LLKQFHELKEKNEDLSGRLKKEEETRNNSDYVNSLSLNEMREEFNNKYNLLIKTHDIFEQKIDKLTNNNSILMKLELKKSEEKNEDLDRRLKKSEEKNEDLDLRLKKSEEKLKKSENDLKETKKELKEIQILFNGYYHKFTDVDGKNKAFIIPLSAMRKSYTFDDSVNLCRDFNSSLIEIDSKEKQIIFESFLRQSGIDFLQFTSFWINAERNYTGKWKWLKSGKEFTFTNWQTSNPYTNSDFNYITVFINSTEKFGKWANIPKIYTNHVICEHNFEF